MERFLCSFAVIFIATVAACCNGCYGKSGALCMERERQALLSFKQDLEDPSNRLRSWTAEEPECCTWACVFCDNGTGNVLHLQLPGAPSLGGTINPSLLDLKALRTLDLSRNDFGGIQIPTFFGSLVSLTFLDLSGAKFGQIIPHELGNLSALHHLDLGNNYLRSGIDNLNWLAALTSLEYLNLEFNSLNSSFPDCLCNLSHLQFLDLSFNEFSGPLCDTFGNLSCLSTLRLSGSKIRGKIFESLRELSNLTVLGLEEMQLNEKMSNVLKHLSTGWFSDGLRSLELGHNRLYGPLYDGFDQFVAEMNNLEFLDLRNNSISGYIPASLGELSSISWIDISFNQLNGTLPESLGQLEMLERIDFSNNRFSGAVSEVHFKNLTRLSILDGSENELFLNASQDWVPSFQLTYLALNSWRMGPRFPLWICSQHNLQILSLPNTGISDVIPGCISNLPLVELRLASNQLVGLVPNPCPTLQLLHLSGNFLSGSLPKPTSTLEMLELSGNLLSGSLSPFLCDSGLMGTRLVALNLQGNQLSGDIPECWEQWVNLHIIILADNYLTGRIPASIGYLVEINSLYLQNNRLFGEIPSSLQYCRQLKILDVAENELAGEIPSWLGRVRTLSFLRLHSNVFQGNIPDELCQLNSMQILDLASNHFIGPIPKCFNNFSGMKTAGNWSQVPFQTFEELFDADIVAKGRELQYNNLQRVKSMDLSDNNLSGEIPGELQQLHGLMFLNLSHNHLSGRIPWKIGDMQSLESLDLSWNQLSGEIPPTITAISFLSYLNLSYNTLTGKIPTGTQIQSMNASSFFGNHLSGPPLENRRNSSNVSHRMPISEGEGGDSGSEIIEFPWFYVSVALGFVVGFWGVTGPLMLNKSWRFAYFQFVDRFLPRFV